MNDASHQHTSSSRLGLVVVLAAAASISFSNILAPIVYASGSNTQTLLVFRFASFLCVCGLWLKIQKVDVSLGRRDLLHCAGAGLVYATGSGSLVAAFAFIPVSLAVLIFYTFPLMTRLAMSLLDRRRPAIHELACLLTALLGLAICLGIGLDRLNGPGLGFAVLAATGVASSYVWTARRLGSVQPTVMTFYMAGTGLILALGFAFTTHGWALPPTGVVAIGLMVAASLTFAGAFFGMFAGVHLIGPSRTAMIMNLEPILTVALAILLLDENLSVHQFLGATLVVAAIFATQIKRPRQSG